MSFRRRVLTVAGVAVLAPAVIGVTSAGAVDTPTYTIAPGLTDPAITDTSPTRGDHLVWLAPKARRVEKLLVFLPTGGLTNIPSEFTELGTVAHRLGYHTIFLAYRNEAPIAASPTATPPGCGPNETVAVTNTCARDARQEILTGDDDSSLVNVDDSNSIYNRLNKVLDYLVHNAPASDEWAQFVNGNGEPRWDQTVIAGASLGAGQAVMIAETHDVYRAALLHGWVDARYPWVKRVATPTEDYFTLIHARDNFFARTCYAYVKLGLAPEPCPLEQFPIPVPATNPFLIEHLEPPYGLQMHVFNLDPGSTMGTGDHAHQSTTRNGWIAREADGITPSHHLVAAWSSVLGDDTDGDAVRNPQDNCPARANAAQTDTDTDGLGDACDTTPQGTTPPTIVVPAPMTVNATGPAGATVAYTATATDDIDTTATVDCAPPPGSRFAIGDTTVACGSTDAAGNAASASFVVTVLGANQQITNLIGAVVNSTKLPAAVKAQLISSLTNRPLPRAAACLTLRAFSLVVQFVVPQPQRAVWIADASRIRAVLAC